MDRGGYFVHSPRFSTFSFSSLVAQGGDAGWARRTPSALAAEAGGGAPPPTSRSRTLATEQVPAGGPSPDTGRQKTAQRHGRGRRS